MTTPSPTSVTTKTARLSLRFCRRSLARVRVLMRARVEVAVKVWEARDYNRRSWPVLREPFEHPLQEPARPKMQTLPPQLGGEPTSDAAREQEAMRLYRGGNFRAALVMASYIGNPSHQKKVMQQIGMY